MFYKMSTKKQKKFKKIHYPCLRRWISSLVPMALFSIIFQHPTRNQFSKTSDLVAFKNKLKLNLKNPY